MVNFIFSNIKRRYFKQLFINNIAWTFKGNREEFWGRVEKAEEKILFESIIYLCQGGKCLKIKIIQIET
jgi:hypothetical protein